VLKKCQRHDPNRGMTEMYNSMDKKVADCHQSVADCHQSALEVCNSDDNDDSLFSVCGICLWNICYKKVMSQV
jgi:hypothetical protein